MLKIYASGKKKQTKKEKASPPPHFNALNSRREGEQIHEVLLALFCSHSWLPPPHIWSIGSARFLCAATWAEGLLEGAAAVGIWSLQLFLLSYVLINSRPACGWSCRQWHQTEVHNEIFTIFACVCGYVCFAGHVYCCWKCPQILEHLQVTGGPSQLYPICLLWGGGSRIADISPFSTAGKKTVYHLPQIFNNHRNYIGKLSLDVILSPGKSAPKDKKKMSRVVKKHTFIRFQINEVR